jgi:hypothetical protein
MIRGRFWFFSAHCKIVFHEEWILYGADLLREKVSPLPFIVVFEIINEAPVSLHGR